MGIYAVGSLLCRSLYTGSFCHLLSKMVSINADVSRIALSLKAYSELSEESDTSFSLVAVKSD